MSAAQRIVLFGLHLICLSLFSLPLFHPNRYEHECYLSLLEDYLENKLKCNEKVRSQRNQIKKFLTKLKEFKVEFEAAHVVLEKEETSQLYLHLIEQLSEQLSV